MRLTIDTDPGIDDAMAILYAHAAPEIEITALTTVYGNVRVDQATRNALRLLDWCGLDDVPVHEGAARPSVLPPFKPSAHVHGDEGFGDMPADVPSRAADPLLAAAALAAAAGRGEALCPVGPLANLAAMLDVDPDACRKAERVVVMGGGIEGGNVTPHAEANIWHDPHAASRLFAQPNVWMVGLDVTTRILVTREDMAALADAAPVLGGRLAAITDFYIRFYESIGREGCALHDPAAVIACTHPHLFDWEETPIRVVTEGEEIGRTVPVGDGAPVKVAVDVDAPAVKALWMERIASLP